MAKPPARSPQRAKLAEVPEKPKRLLARAQTATRELYHRPELSGWTPQKVESAASAADNGTMMRVADLIETMKSDDRIKGVMSTRTHGLMGLPVDFVGGDDQARAMLSTQEGGLPGEWWTMHDESELAKLLTWGLLLGVGLAQRVELPRLVGQPHRYKMVTWSPRWLSYFHYPVNGTHWQVQTQDGLKPVVPGDGEWILFLPYGERRPWSEGIWRALYFPWLLKHFSLEDRANYSEVLGSPLWVANTGKGGTERQRKDLLTKLRSLGKNGKIVLPEGWDLKLQEATGKSWEIYQNQVEWADQAMTIAIAGQLVTTEGTSGFSSGNIFKDISQDLIRFDAERLATALKTQSLEPWALWNFGSSYKAPWPRWQVQKPTDQSEEADGLSKLGDAIAKLDAAISKHGLQVDAPKLLADFDVPVIKTQSATPPSGTV